MGLQWQTKQLRHGRPGHFAFSATANQSLQGHVAGISAFQLSYGSSAHRVQSLGIALETRRHGDTVVVTPRIDLEDGSGHSGHRSSETWVYVTVLGWVASQPGPFFAVTGDLARSAMTVDAGEIALFSGSLIDSFSLRHASGPQGISSISTRVHARLHSDAQHLTALGSAGMRDDSGDIAAAHSLKAGILAALEGTEALGLRLASVSTGSAEFGQANDPTVATFDFDGGVANATALLVSFDLAFGEGSPARRLSHLTAGALTHSATGYRGPADSLQIDGNQVTVTSNVSMYDGPSGHQSTLNQATYLIVAQPPSSAGSVGADTSAD